MTLAEVARFLIPKQLVAETEESLRDAGRRGFELFVLWTGTFDGDRFVARNAHVPQQQSLKLDDGLCVRVAGDALHQLNTWLYANEQLLGVQIHSHPKHAYHSETDDLFPIVTTEGGLSVVSSNFCREGLLAANDAVYRLRAGEWELQRAPDVITVV